MSIYVTIYDVTTSPKRLFARDQVCVAVHVNQHGFIVSGGNGTRDMSYGGTEFTAHVTDRPGRSL